jgi:hypothetical protein
MADYDTHYGVLRQDGIVIAACGAQFWPRVLTFDRTALPSYPPDPDQICLECQRTQVQTPGREPALVEPFNPHTAPTWPGRGSPFLNL